MGFGIRLKKILKDKGMTIKELSEATGISINTLYSITKRDTRAPSDEILFAISKALNIDASELLTLKEMEEKIIENQKNIEQTAKNIETILSAIPELKKRFSDEELDAIQRFLEFVKSDNN